MTAEARGIEGAWQRAASALGVPLTVRDVTDRSWHGPALVLVRPDQYIVRTGDLGPGDPSAVLGLARGAGPADVRGAPGASDGVSR